MVKYQKNKKAAVELSLNLIIMLVIGLTVLGLIIAFVTSFLGSAEDSFKGKLTEDDKTKIDQVKRESGEFAFLSSTANVIQGSEDPGKLYVKIRNPSSQDFNFDGGAIEQGDLKVDITAGRVNGNEVYQEGTIQIYGPAITLGAGQSEGYSLEVYASEEVALGTYYAKFTATIGGEEHHQSITINVE